MEYRLTKEKPGVNQCCGSMKFWCGSGSCYFRQWPSRRKKKFFQVFCLLLFEGTFPSSFKNKTSWRSHKTIGINVFLTLFAWWYKDPDPDPYLWLMDPDSDGRPKSLWIRIRNTGVNWSRIHERTISLRFLGIIFRVLRLDVSVYNVNVYITNQTSFKPLLLGGGGVNVNSKEENS